MHDVMDSAGLRDRRGAETTRALIRAARAFTAERGLGGFTVEELCSEAAVSRRTFFNYFASKEDAVLGLSLRRSHAEAIAQFLAASDEDTARGLSPGLLSDLARLAESRWQQLDIAPDTVADLIAAVQKEPRLLGRMLQLGIEQEKFDARLIEQRESLPPGDLRAELAAQIVGAISRGATGEFLSPGSTETFADIFHRRLDAVRDLFATQTTPTGVLL